MSVKESDLVEIPNELKEYEDKYGLQHKQEKEFVNALQDLHEASVKSPEKFKGRRENIQVLIQKLVNGDFSDFDCDDEDSMDDYSITGLVSNSRRLGLESIAMNAVRGKYDHSYVLHAGRETLEQRNKRQNEWVHDVINSMKK